MGCGIFWFLFLTRFLLHVYHMYNMDGIQHKQLVIRPGRSAQKIKILTPRKKKAPILSFPFKRFKRGSRSSIVIINIFI